MTSRRERRLNDGLQVGLSSLSGAAVRLPHRVNIPLQHLPAAAGRNTRRRHGVICSDFDSLIDYRRPVCIHVVLFALVTGATASLLDVFMIVRTENMKLHILALLYILYQQHDFSC